MLFVSLQISFQKEFSLSYRRRKHLSKAENEKVAIPEQVSIMKMR
jgi:hypothetical protein